MENINRLKVPPLGGGGGTVIVIVGPTASGKTALSLTLARHFDTSIISADSRQCFRELNIGVAKPTPDELAQVNHYFVNSHSIYDTVNAQVFEEYALKAANDIFAHNPYAIMVGGTGLYIKAFCEGLDEIPAVSETIRVDVINHYKTNGLGWLQQEVHAHDADFWAAGEIENPQRLMRALEVKLSTGKSILSFHRGQPANRPFNIIKVGLDIPKATLYNNINKRVDGMVRQGLLDEAKGMLPNRNINALQTVGYKEFFDFFDGKSTFDNAVEQVKLNTRHYAKRQLTWFRKDKAINWKVNNEEALLALLHALG
jgi:tRNA dimethylallyltransferase